MIKIKTFVGNFLQENCYVAHDETNECVIIDCGVETQEERNSLISYIKNNNLKPIRLIGTHGHMDHHFGNDTIYQEFGLLPEVHQSDKYLTDDMAKQASSYFNMALERQFPPIGKYLTEADYIEFGTHQFTIIETPGHTPGSVVFYCETEQIAFTGDTLFKQSIGRTDLPGGSMFQIIQSLRILCQLPDNTLVYPGHGSSTTIGNELASNPYLDR